MRPFLFTILIAVLLSGCGDNEASTVNPVEFNAAGEAGKHSGSKAAGGHIGAAGAFATGSQTESRTGGTGSQSDTSEVGSSGGASGQAGSASSLGGSAIGHSTPINLGGTVGNSSQVSGGTTGCSTDSDCEDANACTNQRCLPDRKCEVTPVTDGVACDDGQACTESESCLAGSCVGEKRTTKGRLLASSYAYGTEHSELGNSSGGLVTFLSDNRVVFADMLYGVGTQLSVVRFENGNLVVEAQLQTSAVLEWGTTSPWLSYSASRSHLLALSENRFALVEGTTRLQVFDINASEIRQVSQYRFTGSAERQYMMSATATNDSIIWGCQDGMTRFQVATDGSLSKLPKLTLSNGTEITGCSQIAVAPDGKTLYAGTSQGIVRFTSSTADVIPYELVLPNVKVDLLQPYADYLALTRRAIYLSFGDVEVYRTDKFERVFQCSPTATELPFGVALVAGKLVVAWHVSSDEFRTRTQVLRWESLDQKNVDSGQLLLRRRTDGLEDWPVNLESFVARGSRTILSPWRRTFDWVSVNAQPRERSEGGYGTIRSLTSVNSNVFATVGPYAGHGVNVTGGNSLSFIGGGTVAAVETLASVQIPLKPAATTPEQFEQREDSVLQKNETETFSLVVPTANGTSVLGSFTLTGGPAQLLVRGRSLFQVAGDGDHGFTVRRYSLSEGTPNQTMPLKPELEQLVTLNAPAELTKSRNVSVDIDPAANQIAIVDHRQSQSDIYDWTPVAVWAFLNETTPKVLGRLVLEASRGAVIPAIMSGKLTLFYGNLLRQYSPAKDGIAEVARLERTGIDVNRLLGFDGDRFVYVSSQDSTVSASFPRAEVLVFDWANGSMNGRFVLPGTPLSAVRVGNRIAVGTKGSLHLFEPVCANSEPNAGADWAVYDASERVAPSDAVCAPLGTCVEWEAPKVAGDANRDGCVDSNDILLTKNCIGITVDPCLSSVLADLDGNGVVNLLDYRVVTKNSGVGCNQ